jgi:hypothetical protein
LPADGVAAFQGDICHNHTALCPTGDVIFFKNNNIRFAVLATFLQFTVKERHWLLAEIYQHPSLPGHIITRDHNIFHLVIRGFSSFSFETFCHLLFVVEGCFPSRRFLLALQHNGLRCATTSCSYFLVADTPQLPKKNVCPHVPSSRQNMVNEACGLSPSGPVADFSIICCIVIIYTICCEEMVLSHTKTR